MKWSRDGSIIISIKERHIWVIIFKKNHKVMHGTLAKTARSCYFFSEKYQTALIFRSNYGFVHSTFSYLSRNIRFSDLFSKKKISIWLSMFFTFTFCKPHHVWSPYFFLSRPDIQNWYSHHFSLVTIPELCILISFHLPKLQVSLMLNKKPF